MQTKEPRTPPFLRLGRTARDWSRRAGRGLVEISQNSLAALGLAVVSVVAVAAWHTELRVQAEAHLLGWLQQRHEARAEASGDVLAGVAEPEAVARATAADPAELPSAQAAVAGWLSRRYRVAPEPIARLVQEAWAVGHKASLDPTLILAVMAVESSFNPFAQSPMGAQGLMQVMTRVHDDKYDKFGGTRAAFDPLTNLRVGVQVLRDCIARAGGSLEDGLRLYVGAGPSGDDSGYSRKVLAEQDYLRQVAGGRAVPANVSAQAAVEPAVPSPSPAAAPVIAPDAAKAAASSPPQRVALLGH